MKWHPYAETYPMLAGAEREDFRDSIIESKGAMQPILYRKVDGEKEYLDGRNRWRECDELTLPCPEQEVWVSDEEVEEFIDKCNLYRRHLTKEQRIERAKLMHQQGHSTRTIAGKLGVNQSTASRYTNITEKQESPGDANASPQHYAGRLIPDEPERVTGRDGKSYSSHGNHRPRPINAPGSPQTNAEPEVEEMVDEAGYCVPAKLRAIFADREKIMRMGNVMSRLIKEMKDIESCAAYKAWEKTIIKGDMHILTSSIFITESVTMQEMAPHSVHQDCKAAGCEGCSGKGYLTNSEAKYARE